MYVMSSVRAAKPSLLSEQSCNEPFKVIDLHDIHALSFCRPKEAPRDPSIASLQAMFAANVSDSAVRPGPAPDTLEDGDDEDDILGPKRRTAGTVNRPPRCHVGIA